MRHRVHGRKLNRSGTHRLALQRNMTKSLFAAFGDREYVITTREKAKFVKPFAEKLITLGKEKSLHNIRRGVQILGDKALITKLFNDIAPRYKDRPGGYLRILRTSWKRLGDKADQVLLGFVVDVESAPASAAVTGGSSGANR